MNPKVSDLSVDELRSLINATVSEAMDEYFEDAEGLRSDNFIQSIAAAREQHAKGETRTFEQIFGGA